MPGRHRVYEPVFVPAIGNIPTRINTRTHIFEGILNYRGEEEMVSASTYAELVKLVQKAAEERLAIVWHPVIVLTIQQSLYIASGIGLTARREYLGLTKGGQLRGVKWELPEEERVLKSDLRGGTGSLEDDAFPFLNGHSVTHRYTAKLWDACETLNLVMGEFCLALHRATEIGVEPGEVAVVLANSVNELSKCTLTQDAARKRALAG